MISLQLAVLFTSIWVFFDARKLGFKKDPSLKSFKNMGPTGWAFGSLLLWIAIFPLYLIERQKHLKSSGVRGLSLLSLGATMVVAVLFGGFSSGGKTFDASGDDPLKQLDEIASEFEKSESSPVGEIEELKAAVKLIQLQVGLAAMASMDDISRKLSKGTKKQNEKIDSEMMEFILKEFDGKGAKEIINLSRKTDAEYFKGRIRVFLTKLP